MPDELRAVHIADDPDAAERLADEWRRLGLFRFPLEPVDCPDRRVTRVVLDVVTEALADGETEVTVLIPGVEHCQLWHRTLHDRTSDAIPRAVSRLPHGNVSFVP